MNSGRVIEFYRPPAVSVRVDPTAAERAGRWLGRMALNQKKKNKANYSLRKFFKINQFLPVRVQAECNDWLLFLVSSWIFQWISPAQWPVTPQSPAPRLIFACVSRWGSINSTFRWKCCIQMSWLHEICCQSGAWSNRRRKLIVCIIARLMDGKWTGKLGAKIDQHSIEWETGLISIGTICSRVPLLEGSDFSAPKSLSLKFQLQVRDTAQWRGGALKQNTRNWSGCRRNELASSRPEWNFQNRPLDWRQKPAPHAKGSKETRQICLHSSGPVFKIRA